MVNVLLHLWDPLPHDGEQVGGCDGGAAQQAVTPTTVWVEEGEVPAGTMIAEGRVNRGVSHGHTAMMGSAAAASSSVLVRRLSRHALLYLLPQPYLYTAIHIYTATLIAHMSTPQHQSLHKSPHITTPHTISSPTPPPSSTLYTNFHTQCKL